ncbi:MAG TPA: ferrochelatase [Acidimicrobiales bacterium]|nr:ferrochelatase [Acidimicrobiales bacterium]
MAERGVLLMAYGTPASADDVERFYTHIRRGSPPSPEQLADLQRRYAAIGGVSPLLERTQAQVRGIQRSLDGADPGRYQTYLGMRHAPPFIDDAVATMHADGSLANAIALVLAPHYSAFNTGEYQRRVEEAIGRLEASGPVRVAAAQGFAFEPELTILLSSRVKAALASDELAGRTVEVLFTAHSLPMRVVDAGDPYPEQVEQSAAAVARYAYLERWRVAWQSAGRTDDPWLGPDLRDVIRDLSAAGVDGVVVCPIGFVSDHLEVLFDIDIEAKRVAEECGVSLVRTSSLNDDPEFMEILAGVIRDLDATMA